MISIAMLADCMEYMATVPDKWFDLAVVDPPYGIGMGATLNVNSKVNYKDKDWDNEIPSDQYFIELQRISQNQIIWGGNYFPILWKNACRGFICWNKLNHHDNRADIEMAWTSIDGLAKYFEYMWDGNRYGVKGNIQGVGKPTIRIHPTEKPIKLYSWIYANYLPNGGKVIDTHGGSMSNVIAALEAGNIKIHCCEIDKDYFDAAEKRIINHFNQLNIFAEKPKINFNR
jgi:site-specific DNA-methyltransferase (adenine-specific)